MKQSSRSFKVLAGVVLTAFLGLEVSQAQAATLRDSVIPEHRANSARLEDNPASLLVSQSFATVGETFRGSSGKLVIHIQDAHTNLGAQKNLARILDEVVSQYGVDLVFVEGGTGDDSLSFLREYASPEVRRRTAMRFLEKGEISGEEYLDIISGPDKPFQLWGIEDPVLYTRSLETYAGITGIRKSALKYLDRISKGVGILKSKMYTKELWELERYAQNFRKSAAPFTDYADYLTAKSAKVSRHVETSEPPRHPETSEPPRHPDASKQARHPEVSEPPRHPEASEQARHPEASEQARHPEAFEQARHPEAPQGPKDLDPHPNLLKLSELRELERKVNFEKATKEQLEILKKLSKSRPILMELAQDTGRIRFGQTPLAALYETIRLRMREEGLDLAAFPNFKEYLEYLDRFARLDISALLEEFDALETALFDAYATDPDTKRLLEISRIVELLRNYFSLKLKPSEFATYRDQLQGFETSVWLGFLNRKLVEFRKHEEVIPLERVLDTRQRDVERFYSTVEARDFAFLDRAVSKMDETKRRVTVLICGGYHTPHLKELLKGRDISYVVVTPHVSEETDMENYERILLGGLDPARRWMLAAQEGTIRQLSTAQTTSKVGDIAAELLFQNGVPTSKTRNDNDNTLKATIDAIVGATPKQFQPSVTTGQNATIVMFPGGVGVRYTRTSSRNNSVARVPASPSKTSPSKPSATGSRITFQTPRIESDPLVRSPALRNEAFFAQAIDQFRKEFAPIIQQYQHLIPAPPSPGGDSGAPTKYRTAFAIAEDIANVTVNPGPLSRTNPPSYSQMVTLLRELGRTIPAWRVALEKAPELTPQNVNRLMGEAAQFLEVVRTFTNELGPVEPGRLTLAEELDHALAIADNIDLAPDSLRQFQNVVGYSPIFIQRTLNEVRLSLSSGEIARIVSRLEIFDIASDQRSPILRINAFASELQRRAPASGQTKTAQNLRFLSAALSQVLGTAQRLATAEASTPSQVSINEISAPSSTGSRTTQNKILPAESAGLAEPGVAPQNPATRSATAPATAPASSVGSRVEVSVAIKRLLGNQIRALRLIFVELEGGKRTAFNFQISRVHNILGGIVDGAVVETEFPSAEKTLLDLIGAERELARAGIPENPESSRELVKVSGAIQSAIIELSEVLGDFKQVQGLTRQGVESVPRGPQRNLVLVLLRLRARLGPQSGGVVSNRVIQYLAGFRTITPAYSNRDTSFITDFTQDFSGPLEAIELSIQTTEIQTTEGSSVLFDERFLQNIVSLRKLLELELSTDIAGHLARAEQSLGAVNVLVANESNSDTELKKATQLLREAFSQLGTLIGNLEEFTLGVVERDLTKQLASNERTYLKSLQVQIFIAGALEILTKVEDLQGTGTIRPLVILALKSVRSASEIVEKNSNLANLVNLGSRTAVLEPQTGALPSSPAPEISQDVRNRLAEVARAIVASKAGEIAARDGETIIYSLDSLGIPDGFQAQVEARNNSGVIEIQVALVETETRVRHLISGLAPLSATTAELRELSQDLRQGNSLDGALNRVSTDNTNNRIASSQARADANVYRQGALEGTRNLKDAPPGNTSQLVVYHLPFEAFISLPQTVFEANLKTLILAIIAEQNRPHGQNVSAVSDTTDVTILLRGLEIIRSLIADREAFLSEIGDTASLAAQNAKHSVELLQEMSNQVSKNRIPLTARSVRFSLLGQRIQAVSGDINITVKIDGPLFQKSGKIQIPQYHGLVKNSIATHRNVDSSKSESVASQVMGLPWLVSSWSTLLRINIADNALGSFFNVLYGIDQSETSVRLNAFPSAVIVNLDNILFFFQELARYV